MLARVACNVYWLSRYFERAENTARLINAHNSLLLDLPKSLGVGWEPLIAITGGEELFYERHAQATEEEVIVFLTSDDNPASILNSLAAARENLRTTRDLIPREAWEQLNDLYLWSKRILANKLPKHNRYPFLRDVIRQVQQITGLLYGSMSRDQVYTFLEIGHYLERADMASRILDVRSANLLHISQSQAQQQDGQGQMQSQSQSQSLTPFESIQWMGVLKSLTAYQMYRRATGLVRVRGQDALRFLLQNQEFPRSLYFCLEEVKLYVRDLPSNGKTISSLERLQRQISSADIAKLSSNPQQLHDFIDALQVNMGHVHSHIDSTYFSGRISA